MSELTIKQAIAHLLNYHNKRISTKQMQALCASQRIKSTLIGRMWFVDQEALDSFDFNSPGRPRKFL